MPTQCSLRAFEKDGLDIDIPAERHDPSRDELIPLRKRRPPVGQVELLEDPEHGLVTVPGVVGGVQIGIAGLRLCLSVIFLYIYVFVEKYLIVELGPVESVYAAHSCNIDKSGKN